MNLVLSWFGASLSTDLLFDPGQSRCDSGVDSRLRAVVATRIDETRQTIQRGNTYELDILSN